MDTEKQTNENGLAGVWAGGMAVAAGLIRLLPHPWNFTPVGALGLFGGARLRSWQAYVLPLAVMAVSDLLLWAIHGINYTPFNPWVYACFALSVVCGQLFLRTGSAWRIGFVSVLVSVLFFLVTNFVSWWTFSLPFTQPDGTVMAPLYARNMSGLMASYIAALPFIGTNAPPLGFFGNQLLGDLFYSAILFGVYAWMRGGVFVPRRLRALSAARTI
ncbi:MAG TPA: DUF6580 family putative transport protein [Gemmataceae bacterium]|nr:DUF6580 family putative transport protein [Gemmataceae bacterium]